MQRNNLRTFVDVSVKKSWASLTRQSTEKSRLASDQGTSGSRKPPLVLANARGAPQRRQLPDGPRGEHEINTNPTATSTRRKTPSPRRVTTGVAEEAAGRRRPAAGVVQNDEAEPAKKARIDAMRVLKPLYSGVPVRAPSDSIRQKSSFGRCCGLGVELGKWRRGPTSARTGAGRAALGAERRGRRRRSGVIYGSRRPAVAARRR